MHLAIPVAWGLRPLLAVLTPLVALNRFAARRQPNAFALGALATYALVPQLAAPLLRRAPSARGAASPRCPRVREIVGGLVALVVDGLGFWLAARDALTGQGAPPKTPR